MNIVNQNSKALSLLHQVGLITSDELLRAHADPYEFEEDFTLADVSNALAGLMLRAIVDGAELQRRGMAIQALCVTLDQIVPAETVVAGASVILAQFNASPNRPVLDGLLADGVLTQAERDEALACSAKEDAYVSSAEALADISDYLFSEERKAQVFAMLEAGSAQQLAMLRETREILRSYQEAFAPAAVAPPAPIMPTLLLILGIFGAMGLLMWWLIRARSFPS